MAFGTTIEKTNDQHGERKSYPLSESLKEQIREETKGMSADEIAEYAMDQTCKQLKFRADEKVKDGTGEGHCVTYAGVCTAIANEAFRANRKRIHGEATHEVGTIKMLGMDFCKIAYAITKDSFCRNHDFVTFKTDSGTYSLDPSAKDLLGFDLKTVRKQR